MKMFKPCFHLSTLAAFLSLTACGPRPAATANLQEIQNYILKDTYALQNSKLAKSSSEAVLKKELKGDRCSTVTRKHDHNAIDELSLYDVNSDSLWVGNLVQTADVANGVLNSIYAKRAPMRISIQGRARHVDGSLLSSAGEDLPSPSASSYEDARQKFVGSGFEPMGKFKCSVDSVRSEQEAKFALNLNANWSMGAKLSTSVRHMSANSGKTLIVNCTQVYYTVNLDTPVSPESVFDTAQDIESLKATSDPVTNPIGYISSVNYGKRVIVLLKSEQSADQLQAELDGQMRGLKLNTAVEIKNAIATGKVQVLTEGGTPEDISSILGITPETAIQVTQKIFSPSEANQGVREDRFATYAIPLSYKVNFLSNNKTMKLGIVGDYSIEEVIDPSMPILKNVVMNFQVRDDDADKETALAVQIQKGGDALPGLNKLRGSHWGDEESHSIGYGDISAAQLIGADWSVEMGAKGSDHVNYQLQLMSEGRLIWSTERLQITEGTQGGKIYFPVQRKLNQSCEMSSEARQQAEEFTSKYSAK